MLAIVAGLFVLVSAMGTASKAASCRAHRDVGGFIGYSCITALLLLMVISFFVVPGVWEAVGRFATRLYGGD